jgi:hypothetical protein
LYQELFSRHVYFGAGHRLNSQRQVQVLKSILAHRDAHWDKYPDFEQKEPSVNDPTREFQTDRRRQIYAVHRDIHRGHFDAEGRWTGPFSRDAVSESREWLWHAFAFLEGDEEDVRLGNTIVAATPNTANHFNSLSAAQLMLHYADRLDERAKVHLDRLMQDGFAESVDFSLAAFGVNNFTCLRALFFLAASQFMELYEVPYVHKSIPEVYNKFRIRQFGRNILVLLENQLSRVRLSEEFNSPNYSALSIAAISEIVNWIDDDEARAAAVRIERRLWEELLGFHHPRLFVPSAPFSRAYMADTVAHGSLLTMVRTFLGIDGERRVEDLIYPPVAGQVVLPGGDVPHNQCICCWLIRPEYHVPADVLKNFREREFPYTLHASYLWSGQGYQRPDGSVVRNVEGDWRTSGGQGLATCYQDETFSIGSSSESQAAQGHSCEVAYSLVDAVPGLGAVRTASMTMAGRPSPRLDPQ